MQLRSATSNVKLKKLPRFVTISMTVMSIMQSAFAQQDTGTVTDIDGNIYKTVKIGEQWWTSENLRTRHFNDGTPIPYSPDSVALGKNDYTGYYKFPNNDSSLITSLGLLYSWGTIANQTGTQLKNICPEGWKIADTSDWNTLVASAGGKTVAGGKLKGTSTLWAQSSNPGVDKFKFNALPAGDFNTAGFTQYGSQARFWTPALVQTGGAGRIYAVLFSDSLSFSYGQYRNVNCLSLRMVKTGTTTAISNRTIRSELKKVNSFLTCRDILTISAMNPQATIHILSSNGRIMKTGIISSSGNVSVDMSHLPSGIFYYMIYGNNTISKGAVFHY